jgi:hypothetical protein
MKKLYRERTALDGAKSAVSDGLQTSKKKRGKLGFPLLHVRLVSSTTCPWVKEILFVLWDFRFSP